jgi:hypothetical protein
MHLARFTLTRTETPTQVLAEIVHDAIWAHLPEHHGVEHITATATPVGIDLVLFLSHEIDAPQRHAQQMLEAVAQLSPTVEGLTWIDVLLPVHRMPRCQNASQPGFSEAAVDRD